MKIVQTGIGSDEEGDAQRAARLAEMPWRELARFPKAADPWAAALDAGETPLQATALATQLEAAGCVVAEGAGGIMVPLNGREQIGDVAVRAKLAGGRGRWSATGLHQPRASDAAALQRSRHTGCRCGARRALDRDRACYRDDVRRALEPRARILGVVAYRADEAASVAEAAALFEPLVKQER